MKRKARRLTQPTGRPVKVHGPGCTVTVGYPPVDEENPPHPDERVYATRHDHWSRTGSRYGDYGMQERIARDLGLITRQDAHKELVAMGIFSPNSLTSCWCGQALNHYWPGKLEGEPHP